MTESGYNIHAVNIFCIPSCGIAYIISCSYSQTFPVTSATLLDSPTVTNLPGEANNEQLIQKERGDMRSKVYMKSIKDQTQNGK